MTTYELASIIVQAVTGFAILGTFFVYYFQLRTMQCQLNAVRDSSTAQNILEVVNFLQSNEVREARTIVRVELEKKDISEWSATDRQAASIVCANYDVAAVLLREELVPIEPFIDNWGPSIKHCYEVLLPYIREMQHPDRSGPSYWDDFGWLYEKVAKKAQSVA
jgi:hypothetical protein